MCDPELQHRLSTSWRTVMHSLCRTKRVRMVMSTPSDDESNNASNKRSCFPCELARLGVANGSSLAAGVFLVVGYVAGNVAGPSVVISLIIAAFVSLLTGLCYAEYISHQPACRTSATSPQYFYIITGEFTSNVVAWVQICFYTASGAAFARAISSTFDILVNGAISNFTDTMTERYPYVQRCDFLAGGIVIVIVMVITFGGKVLECWTVSMSVLSLIVLIPLIILSGMYGGPENWTDGKGFFPFQHSGVFTGTAMCVFLFGGYEVIATGSKDKSQSSRVIGVAILSSNFINLVALINLAIFLTLLVPYATLAEGCPLPTIFHQYAGQLGKITIGIVAMLCLGSATMSNISSLVYTTYLLGGDGLIPKGCGTLNKRTTTPVVAATITGAICVIEALVLEFGLLLEVIAIAVLAHQTIICAATLATRYRPLESDVDIPITHIETNSALHKQKNNTLKQPTSKSSTKRADINPFQEYLDADSSEDETDIDDIVEEYRAKEKTAKMSHIEGPDNAKPPSPIPTLFTSTLAAVSSSFIVAWCVAIGAILNFLLPFIVDINPWVISSVVLFTVFLVITCVVLVLQPRREIDPAFRIPCFPVIPVAGIGTNVFLLFTVSGQAWILFTIWFIQGVCAYVFYGVCHSVESQRYSYRIPDEEVVLLSPLPEQVLRTKQVNGQAHRDLNIGYQHYHES